MKRTDIYGVLIITLLLAILFAMGHQERIENLRAACWYEQSQPECKELEEVKA